MSSIDRDDDFVEILPSSSGGNNPSELVPINSDIETFKQQLRLKVHQYGDFKFEDDEWYYKNSHRTSAEKAAFTINFGGYSQEFKEWLKYFALMERSDVGTVKSKIFRVNCFLEFFRDNFHNFKLLHINRKIINEYEEFLRGDISLSANVRYRRYGALKNFFKIMSRFPEFPESAPTKNKSPFSGKDAGRSNKDSEKYIPTKIVKQFDKIMKNENHEIPDSFRLAYWLQRSFPNRITEVTSIPINCLKPLYSMYVINVPTTKQNGGFITEEIKTIPVLNSGHGKYIVDLIKKVQKRTADLLELYPVNEKDKSFLMLETTFKFEIEKGKIFSYNYAEVHRKMREFRNMFPADTPEQLVAKMNQAGYPIECHTVRNRLTLQLSHRHSVLTPFSSTRFNNALNRIAKLCKITDEEGNIFSISSHQFRHNATTDRLYIGGFTMDQAMALRNDKGTTMINEYNHQQKEMHKEMWMEASGLKSPTDAPVEFKARIFNLDDTKVIERLSKNPSTYLTWETNGKKGVGFCSMISGCKPDGTSVHFECYECNWFVPKAEYHEDYKKELEYWNGIMRDSARQPKRAATYENAIRNVNCLERIVQICENGIEKYKKEIEKKVVSGELQLNG